MPYVIVRALSKCYSLLKNDLLTKINDEFMSFLYLGKMKTNENI